MCLIQNLILTLHFFFMVCVVLMLLFLFISLVVLLCGVLTNLVCVACRRVAARLS